MGKWRLLRSLGKRANQMDVYISRQACFFDLSVKKLIAFDFRHSQDLVKTASRLADK